MNAFFTSLWGYFLGPVLQRPRRLQMAALCHRGEGVRKEFLLVTSRDTGRWIIPKGWPIRGLNSNETALQEAWEEAGVLTGKAEPEPIGTFNYHKRKVGGLDIPVQTLVYAVAVEELADDFPEAHERTRRWVNAKTAADLVQETELKSIFLAQ